MKKEPVLTAWVVTVLSWVLCHFALGLPEKDAVAAAGVVLTTGMGVARQLVIPLAKVGNMTSAVSRLTALLVEMRLAPRRKGHEPANQEKSVS